MKTVISFIVLWLSGLTIVKAQCKIITFEQGVAQHLITQDLFATAIDYQQFICPQYFQGDTTQCGTITSSHDNWDASLPDGLIFTAIFNASEYVLIKPVLKDPFFLDAIAKVPDPSPEAMVWFNNRKIGNEMVIPLEDDTIHVDSLDHIQKKMITVFYNIRSWTFCPETPTISGGLIRGVFNPGTKKIVIYKDACLADKVYDSDVSSAALAFKLFFVSSHELGHVVDDASGKLADIFKTEAEYRANVFGLIMTEAFSKLVNMRLTGFQKVIHNYPNILPCDIAYIDRTVKTWSTMDQYFVARIAEAKTLLKQNSDFAKLSKAQKNWNIYACLQNTSK